MSTEPITKAEIQAALGPETLLGKALHTEPQRDLAWQLADLDGDGGTDYQCAVLNFKHKLDRDHYARFTLWLSVGSGKMVVNSDIYIPSMGVGECDTVMAHMEELRRLVQAWDGRPYSEK